MINLKDGSPADLAPQYLKEHPEVQAIGYAVQCEIARMYQYSQVIRLRATVDTLPEDLIDYLAIELRSPYYDTSLPLDKKREIIKHTLKWHAHLGTVQAVKELFDIVFGEDTGVMEWFEYGDKPFYFAIVTEAILRKGIFDQIWAMLWNVKNTRSWLRKLVVIRKVSLTIHAGASHSEYYREGVIRERYGVNRGTDQTIYAGAAGYSYQKQGVLAERFDLHRHAESVIYSGSDGFAYYRTGVMQERYNTKRTAGTRMNAGAGSRHLMRITIEEADQ